MQYCKQKRPQIEKIGWTRLVQWPRAMGEAGEFQTQYSLKFTSCTILGYKNTAQSGNLILSYLLLLRCQLERGGSTINQKLVTAATSKSFSNKVTNPSECQSKKVLSNYLLLPSWFDHFIPRDWLISCWIALLRHIRSIYFHQSTYLTDFTQNRVHRRLYPQTGI